MIALGMSHHVCLPCRRVIKRKPHHTSKCPHCARAMVDMGKTFKTPKKRDDKAWRDVARRVHAQIARGAAEYQEGRSPVDRNYLAYAKRFQHQQESRG